MDAVIEFIFSFLGEVVFFQLGRFYLRLLTLGRYNSTLETCKNSGLVSLFGFAMTFTLVLSIAVLAHHH
ncbi:MAG: hypothetical protein PHX38_04565 [Sulfuricella sp.]|nr:hypothetical protein [Sulfuricella sp.]